MKSYTIDELNNFDKSALAAIILTMQDQIVHMSNQLDKLTELIAVMNQRQFGKKSEVVDDEYQQLSFFTVYNEAEANADNSDEAPADEIIVNSYKKSKSVGKRKEDLSGLPTKIISHKLSEAELSELFPNGYKELPEQVYTRLTVVPRTFIVEEHHVHVYAPKDEDKKIVRAPRPVDLFRNSIATPSLVAAVITAKYNLHQPLDRQAKDFKASGININTNILANWVIKSSEYYLAMFVDYLHEKLYSEKLLHADETFFKVIRDGKESDAKNYMWVYRNNPDIGSHNIIIYDFQKSRNTSHPLEFLKGFKGTLVTDGYQVYHLLENKREDLIVAGCWVHAKRKFMELVKALGKNGIQTTTANEAVKKIAYIFHVDNTLNELSSKERTKLRQDKVKPLVDDFFSWAKEMTASITPGSQTAKALNYCINQETYLRRFLDDGDIPMDNNYAEQAIRPFTVGRKNWVTVNSLYGADASAVMYSLVETAKANNLKVLDYFELLLTEIPKHQNNTNKDFLENLLPWNPNVQEKCHVGKIS